MARRKRTPGELVIERFAAAGISVRRLAELVDRDHSRIVRLTKPPPQGTGGRIPAALLQPLLQVAADHGISLSADDLIRGA